MRIREIINKEVWQGFLRGIKVEKKTFLQSWQWGEFEKAMEHKIWRFGVYGAKSNIKNQISKIQSKNQNLGDEENLIAIAQVIKIEAKRGRHLLLPHGPIIQNQKSNIKNQNDKSKCKKKILEVLVQKLKEIAKQEKCVFVRIAPVWGRGQGSEKVFKGLGFKRSQMHTHPELTWVLDLESSEDELLTNMRKTSRYLIKQGMKNPDLEIIKSQNVEDVEVFEKIYQETAQRHHFVPFSIKYLGQEFLVFSRDSSATSSPQNDKGEKLMGLTRNNDRREGAVIFLAKHKGEPIAAAIVIYWQGIAFYHQGASSQKHCKIPASYLLQWEAIREAKNRGCNLYNFWGIAPIVAKATMGNPKSKILNPCPQMLRIKRCRRAKQIQNSRLGQGYGGQANFKIQNKKHPWRGLTLFKMGFGGYPLFYLKTQDLALSKKYWLTYFFEKLRRKKRGF